MIGEFCEKVREIIWDEVKVWYDFLRLINLRISWVGWSGIILYKFLVLKMVESIKICIVYDVFV